MNKNLFKLYLAITTIVVCFAGRVPSASKSERKLILDVDPISARALLNNDFESGFEEPWYDSSPSNVHWTVEDFSSQSESNNQAPPPSAGTKYLRATRNEQLSSGLLILRTVTFTAFPGDEISFNFWIRSRYTGGNTLDLVLVEGNTESTLVALSSYSTSVNREWRPASSFIPVTEPTEVTLVFYAYCGGNAEDAIAIDDIVVESTITTTMTMPTTTPDPLFCNDYFSEPSGNITSPNYPNPYGINENCEYRIQVADGNRIVLNFLDFNTESGADYVTVYDGLTTASPVLLRASGLSTDLLTTTSGSGGFIVHTSDGANSFKGWSATNVERIKVDPLSARMSLDNDFESGFLEPWYDSSPNTVHWVVETYSYPTENYLAPPPANGYKYLRAVRDALLTPGLLTLRTVTFTAFPGDEILFNFWIRSKYMGGNTLEVVQSVEGVETIFLVLSRYSTQDNFDWLGASSPLPVSEPTEMTLVFYAFCGGNAEDAIAIDDIILKPCETCTTPETDPASSSTTTTPITTTAFNPPTVPCIGCSTSKTSTETTAPPTTSDYAGTTVFTPPTVPCVGCLKLDPLSARSLLNNNFESGSAYPWYDNSSNSLHWVVEDFSSPTENYPPPTPTAGAKYLRATRDAQATPGQLILRTVTFTAFPGDKFSFNFWIRSKYTGGNFLELVLSNGGVETRLVELSGYSTSVNLEWRPMTVAIPISEPTDVTFIFFAFCGGNAEDAIAIDDIVVGSSDTETSTSVITTTTTTPNPEICGGIYNAASGTVTSPNYPSPYGFDEDCRYKISIPSGNGIKLDFTYFNTENGHDFVTVYDGPTAASAVLLRASGFNVNLSVTTSTRDCLILHTSDWKNSLAGWTATYASV